MSTELYNLTNENSFFQSVFYELSDYVSDVDNVNYEIIDHDLNEVENADLTSMDIREVQVVTNTEQRELLSIEILGNIELTDYAYEEEKTDYAEINFIVTCSTYIENEKLVLKEVLTISQV